MKAPLEHRTPLHVPPLHRFERGEVIYLLDAEAPNWVAVDSRGGRLVEWIENAERPAAFGDLVARYAQTYQLEAGTAWLHVHDFLRALMGSGLAAATPFDRPAYPGRAALTAPDGLRELWMQINNACNLECTHCLVSSGPGKAPGLPPDRLETLVDRAAALGLERLYVTGGEPLLRKDLFHLLNRATSEHGLEAIVLTNGTIIKGAIREGLRSLDRERVRFQISVDGATPGTNDPIRGKGTFEAALAGARTLADLGFDISLSTVTTEENLAELHQLPVLARSVGAKSQHLMWSHRKGRAAVAGNGFFPHIGLLLESVMRTVEAAETEGIALDNVESVKRRVNGVPGLKYDLGNGGWDSLCVYVNGSVFPTAALVGEPKLLCGDISTHDLGSILEDSPVVRRLRETSLAQKPSLQDDPFRFLTGGGDWEHAWWATGDALGVDPYYPIATALVRHVMTTLGEEKLARRNDRSGYDAPLLFHAMGEGAIACGTADGAAAEQPVLTLHSNCVLSFDVDRPRAKVREFYGEAAEEPNADLCCPTRYDDTATDHIPKDVLDRFYGCGSPMAEAGIQPGDVVVDLGSGAGIDVFIAARLVGPEGTAIGIDMTEGMLRIAAENRPRVAEALGYDVVDFRKGFLEEIPVEAGAADLVTSNCVINLSPDKPRVFEEMWRILKDHGRIVISDIVSEREVPPHLKVNPRLWGECLVGALTQEEFLSRLERAGFYGLTVLSRTFWKEIEGYPFFSLTVEGHKFEKRAGCQFSGHRAVYLGPGKALVDEEGHLFPRNEPYEVCTDTVAKLSRQPYRDSFAILEPGDDSGSYTCCSPDRECC
jgi:MoaA/NifB/PqqE/SkfB family radical SAM enzyme/SAM-dependent methyltransferase